MVPSGHLVSHPKVQPERLDISTAAADLSRICAGDEAPPPPIAVLTSPTSATTPFKRPSLQLPGFVPSPPISPASCEDAQRLHAGVPAAAKATAQHVERVTAANGLQPSQRQRTLSRSRLAAHSSSALAPLSNPQSVPASGDGDEDALGPRDDVQRLSSSCNSIPVLEGTVSLVLAPPLNRSVREHGQDNGVGNDDAVPGPHTASRKGHGKGGPASLATSAMHRAYLEATPSAAAAAEEDEKDALSQADSHSDAPSDLHKSLPSLRALLALALPVGVPGGPRVATVEELCEAAHRRFLLERERCLRLSLKAGRRLEKEGRAARERAKAQMRDQPQDRI